MLINAYILDSVFVSPDILVGAYQSDTVVLLRCVASLGILTL